MDDGSLTVIAVGLVMLAGLFGTVLPLLPGLPLIWGAALFFAFQEDWDAAARVAIVAISALMIAGIAAKVILPARKLSATGVPRSTLMVGGLAGVVGFFVIPVIGLPVGAVAGVYLAERRRTGNARTAWASTRGAVIGFGIGALIEVVAGVAMVLAWVVWVIVAR